MAYQQNGQTYRGQYQGSPNTPNQYGSASPRQNSQQDHGRRSSFESGDDQVQSDRGSQEPEQFSRRRIAYRSASNAGQQNQELFMSPTGPAQHTRTYSAGGYQHQSSAPPPPPPPPIQPSYNPQQYGRPQSQYVPPISNNVSAGYNANFQTYVPAAYQSTIPNSSIYGGQQQNASTNMYGNSSLYQNPVQPPAVPPRQPEQPYGNRRLSQAPTSQYSNYPQESSNLNAPLPPIPGTSSLSRPSAYTPPAPPPPPFSPSHDAFPPNANSPSPMRPYAHTTSSTNAAPPYTSNNRPAMHHRLPSLPGSPYNSGNVSTPPAPLTSSPHQSPGTSTPGPPPPLHSSPQRTNTTGRHPQARPLPGPPAPSYNDAGYFDPRNGGSYPGTPQGTGPSGLDDIMKEVESAVMGRPPSSTRQQSPRLERINFQSPIDEEEEEPQPLFSGGHHNPVAPDANHTHTNGVDVTTQSQRSSNNADESEDSDFEAQAGLAAMRLAEEQEAADLARKDDIRRESEPSATRSHGSQGSSRLSDLPIEAGSDSDVPFDMDTYGGGLPGHLNYQYGEQPIPQPNQTPEVDAYGYPVRASDLPGQSHPMGDTPAKSGHDYFMPDDDAIHPFPTFGARVDSGGTGGLAEPSALPRRLSFEDGDELTLVDSDAGHTSGTQSPMRDEYSSVSYPSSRSPSRPLPRVPGIITENQRQRRQTDNLGRPLYPVAPDEYDQFTPAGTLVQKANSIGSQSTTPLVVPPGRSITDAEQRRRQVQQSGLRQTVAYDSAVLESSSTGKLTEIDLPAIPPGKRKKFNPAKLSNNDFKKCPEPWAESSILGWIKEMSEGEADLKEHAIVDGIVALFTNKVPTMNTAEAEVLSARLVEDMFNAGALVKDEEWVKFGSQQMSGVLFQLTGTGCYSPMAHNEQSPSTGRCYSHHCMRTLKKINLQTEMLEPQRKVEDWVTFYKLKKDDIEGVNKKEIERQNILHEIVTTEDTFMDQLNVLRILYRDELAKSTNSPQPIISPKKLNSFLSDVFGKVDAVKKVNEDYLLAQLKYRQQEQGPWIVGFSDIFREWVRKAKTMYIEYAASFPNATLLVRREAEKNVLFRQFLDQMRENERSKRLGWDTYLKAPITRLQRYGLLLSTVYKNMIPDSEEKSTLQKAIEEIKVITLECDTRVAEMSKHVDLSDLATKLRLRPGMEKVQLNLTHLGREIIFQGDLQRTGSKNFTWLETHAILFDHYMVLAKPIQSRDAAGGIRHEAYDVSKLPIPMDLLVLESANDDPVAKSTVRGIASVTGVTARSQTPQEAWLSKTISNQSGTTGPGSLMHASSSNVSTMSTSSNRTIVASTVLDSPKENEKIMYPFRVKHLGKSEVYVLYAPTAQNRQDWCDKIVEAKTRHAASLFAQNAEPFRLRVVADTAFGYDSTAGGPRTVVIRGTPLDRAIREVEKAFDGAGPRPGFVCRAAVNCATAFQQPYGKQMVAVGTNYGVYISEYANPRGWSRAIAASRVTQIAVLEEFSLMVLIADKSLIAYHLDTVCPVSGTPGAALSESSSRRAPQKLSGARDVGFFATGRMKDRTLVFYKKREGISSTFKVLEPVYQKSMTSTRARFGMGKKLGQTEFFRDFDDFYIPSETYALNLFHSSLAIATARGFEVLTLDKKVPFSIPDLKPPDCASIAARIRDQKPLGMFRLSDSEFLLVYEEVGIYVNKHGDVSRAVVMEFVGRARQAVLYAGCYLVLVDTESGFVEVRNAVNGRLRQVVSGKDVRLLDDGGGVLGMGQSGTIKICMQHPEWERCQVVFEMIVNEGLKE